MRARPAGAPVVAPPPVKRRIADVLDHQGIDAPPVRPESAQPKAEPKEQPAPSRPETRGSRKRAPHPRYSLPSRTTPLSILESVPHLKLADRPTVWLTLWALFCVFLVVRTGTRDRGVITDHLEFGRRLVTQQPLYAPYLDGERPLHPVYPPSFGLMTAPFAAIGEVPARWVWGLLQAAALTWIGLMLLHVLRANRPRIGIATTAGTLALTLWLTGRYVLRDTHGGGGNLINLAMAMTAWWYTERHKPARAGAALGISLATKPTTALLLPFFLAIGRPRTALWSLVTAGALTAVTTAVHGFAAWRTWITGSIAYSARSDLYATPEFGYPPFSWMNQSLRPAIARFTGTVPERFSDQVGSAWVSGLGLDHDTTLWIFRLVMAALLVTGFGFARLRRRTTEGRFVGLAAMLSVSLLLSPISWKAHHVALLPAMLVLASNATIGPRRAAAWSTVLVYTLACLLGEELVGKDFKNLQQSLYLTTAGTLCVLGWVLLDRPMEHDGLSD